MRFLLALCLATSSCVACAGRLFEAPAADPSVTLSTPYGFGHGCYVEGMLYTARHVVQPNPNYPTVNVSWRDGYGQEGFAVVVATSSFTDLAMLKVVAGEPYLNHQKNRDLVSAGTKVEWYEYSYSSLPNAYRAHLRRAKVLRYFGGLIALDGLPVSGASGSCVFDPEGKVLGLIVWGDKELKTGIVARIHD